jgi:ATP-dependent Lhr-like helicase
VLALCAAGSIGIDSIARVLRRAAPFAGLTDVALRQIVDHLETGGETLEAYSEARRIERTPDGFVLAGVASERAYLRGVGTIVDEPAVAVRMGGRQIGHLDGHFASTLAIGDRFALGGANWRVVAQNAEALEVTRERRFTQKVARWAGQRPSQSETLTDEVRRLFGEIDAQVPEAARDDPGLRHETIEKLAGSFALEPANARALVKLVIAQREDSAMPTRTRCVVELVDEGTRVHIVAHTFAGVMANEVIGRVAGARIRRASGRGTQISTTDVTLAITVADAPAALADETALRALFDPSELHRDLAETLEGGTLARSSFREVARVSQLASDRGRPGAASPALLYDVLRKHAPGHVLLRALEQTIWASLDGERAERVLDWMRATPWRVACLREPSVLAIPVFLTSPSRENIGPEDMESALVAAAHAMYLRHGAAQLP